MSNNLTAEFSELSGFNRDILIVIYGKDTPKGTEIMRELESYYNDDVNHGRLYPNLDDLVDSGYLEKISLDKRSNGYILTDDGKGLVQSRQRWEEQMAGDIIGERISSPQTENEEIEFEHTQGSDSSVEDKQGKSNTSSANTSSDDKDEESEFIDGLMDGFGELDGEEN